MGRFHAWIPLALAASWALLPCRAGALVALGASDAPADAIEVEVVGDIAYVVDWGGGLRVIDVSIPTAPMELV